MHHAKHLLSLAVFAAALSSLPAHANLVVNGGFETGDFSGWTTAGFDPNLPPALQFSGVDNRSPQAGLYGAFFGTVTPSSITQTLSTVVGARYDLSFYLQNEANGLGLTVPNSFMLIWGGTPQVTVIDAPAFSYSRFQYSLVATSASTDLTFAFTHTPQYWDLDSVDVEGLRGTPVPEPTSLALAGLGGALALAFTRRRRAA